MSPGTDDRNRPCRCMPVAVPAKARAGSGNAMMIRAATARATSPLSPCEREIWTSCRAAPLICCRRGLHGTRAWGWGGGIQWHWRPPVRPHHHRHKNEKRKAFAWIGAVTWGLGWASGRCRIRVSASCFNIICIAFNSTPLFASLKGLNIHRTSIVTYTSNQATG